MHKLPTDKLLIATHNKGKLAEFRQLLGPYVKEIISAGELNLPEPEETGETFYDNALLKAQAAMQATGIPSLADDSGLCVNALDGQPGVFSARWAGPEKDLNMAMQRVHQELGQTQDRSAYFVCALVLVWPNGQNVQVEGRCDGDLVWPPRGTGGHGYDPVFQPTGETRTFAEMAAEEKDKESHRGRALTALRCLFDQK